MAAGVLTESDITINHCLNFKEYVAAIITPLPQNDDVVFLPPDQAGQTDVLPVHR
jgi:hypothetical protein